MGSIAQIELVSYVKKEFLTDNGVFIVDPVMGDGGKLYAGFSENYIAKMRELCRTADYILPNVTEACYLADIPYPVDLKSINKENLFSALQKICKRPIVTGLTDNGTVSVLYTDETENILSYSHENVQGFFHGAGDVFSAAFVGALARGKEETTAVRLASEFTAASIRRSAKEVPDKRYGLNFEAEIFSFLKNLND